MRTKRLQRQLKKAFGDESVEDRLVALSARADLAEAQGLESFPDFLNAVEETYQQLEERVNLAQRSMELSAAELTESNARLFRMNQTFDAMLNSLGQGFLLFGPDGRCLDIHSKACEELLEKNPAGCDVAEVLGVPAHKREAFKGWLEILFQDRLDFSEFAKLGPSSFNHSQAKKISIEYRPVRGSEGQIDFVMLIATDFTKEFEAREAAKEMRAHVILVTSILRDKDRFIEFVAHTRKLIAACASLVHENPEKSFTELKRHIHTLKGASGSFGMLAMQTRLHDLETEIAKRETPENAVAYLRTEVAKLRDLFERALEDNSHIIGNLSVREEVQRRVPLAKLGKLKALVGAGDPRVSELVDELLAVPCADVFARYESLVRDVAVKLGKKVRRITLKDDGVRLMPEKYPGLFESLDHVFRNVVDHGIEAPDERVASGKTRDGTISVTVAERPGQLEIRISDDGRGIAPEKIRRKLRDMGHTALASGTREEVLAAIFLPGLSTSETVTQTSGRGVGMDAVKAAVEACGGSISVESEEGRGTTFVILLPLHPVSSRGGIAA